MQEEQETELTDEEKMISDMLVNDDLSLDLWRRYRRTHYRRRYYRRRYYRRHYLEEIDLENIPEDDLTLWGRYRRHYRRTYHYRYYRRHYRYRRYGHLEDVFEDQIIPIKVQLVGNKASAECQTAVMTFMNDTMKAMVAMNQKNMAQFWESMAYIMGDMGKMESSCSTPQVAWDFVMDMWAMEMKKANVGFTGNQKCMKGLYSAPMEVIMWVNSWGTMDRAAIVNSTMKMLQEDRDTT